MRLPCFYMISSPPYLSAGPAIAIDTACSSSLSASLLLRRMLLEGRCRHGLVSAGKACKFAGP